MTVWMVFALLLGFAIIIANHIDPPGGNKSQGWDFRNTW